MSLIKDLNTLYRSNPELHAMDFDAAGFEWVWADDTAQSVLSYQRQCDDRSLIVILNFTPVPRHGYAIGVDEPGRYEEIFNSDKADYGGSNVCNTNHCETRQKDAMGRPCSLSITLPPLGAIVLKRTE